MDQNSKIPEELAFFDQLPDRANVRLKTVKQLFGISAATVWRQAGKTIPAPKKWRSWHRCAVHPNLLH